MKRIASTIFRRLSMPYLQSSDWVSLYKLKRELTKVPRYTPGRIEIKGWKIEYVDAASFVSAFETVVLKRHNDFNPLDSKPSILDCGANIGVSVIHYKKLFPNAKIIAFEPDSAVCAVLRRNLSANSISDVEVVEAAVWKEDGEMEFFSEGADAGRLDNNNNEIDNLVDISPKGTKRRVRTVRLADYINTPIDFIKLDIEGAESDVINDCIENLVNVREMVVEFHMMNSRPRELAVVMNALAETNFHVSANSYGEWISLINKDSIKRNAVEFDQYMLLNAWR